jgi:hypothetical protein
MIEQNPRSPSADLGLLIRWGVMLSVRAARGTSSYHPAVPRSVPASADSLQF